MAMSEGSVCGCHHHLFLWPMSEGSMRWLSSGTILASVMGVTRCLLEHPNSISLRLLPKAAMVKRTNNNSTQIMPRTAEGR
jgi:hypothetical protein